MSEKKEPDSNGHLPDDRGQPHDPVIPLDDAMSVLLALQTQLHGIQKDCQITDDKLNQLEANLATALQEDDVGLLAVWLEEHNRTVQQLQDTLAMNSQLASMVLNQATTTLPPNPSAALEAAAAAALQSFKEAQLPVLTQPANASASSSDNTAAGRSRKRSVIEISRTPSPKPE